MLKVFAQPQASVEPITYVFTFTSPTKARAEADALRDALSEATKASKAQAATPAATVTGGAGGSSAAMAIASAVSGRNGNTSDSWYDDDKLRTDIELQQSLLKANPTLSKTFMESLRTKPESITSSQFTAQFWSSRLNLLRAHAIERSQSKGSYNVLSTIKSRTEDNVAKLNITREQINLIFSQHPLVKRVYDECVPKLSEEQFWSRFFQSRLLKKLKGEKITEADPKDNVLDKYLNLDDDLERAQRMLSAHIPHIIDLAGNEVNHSQRLGNAPDLPMRPTSVDRVPIIRTLNSLSEKILAHVTPNDADPSAPIGLDEETYNSLALRDLQGDAEEDRIILNIKDQSRFFSSSSDDTTGIGGFKFSTSTPASATLTLQPSLTKLSHGLDLSTAIGFDPDSSDSSDSDSDAPQKKTSTHIGSKAALRQASAQISTLISQQRAQAQDLSTDFSASYTTTSSTSTHGLSQTVFDRLILTHATTTEFLQHFYSAFLSGNASRADEVARLVETLDRAMDRIKAVAQDAEGERRRELGKQKAYIRELYERKGTKVKFDPGKVRGGEGAGMELMAPTV